MFVKQYVMGLHDCFFNGSIFLFSSSEKHMKKSPSSLIVLKNLQYKNQTNSCEEIHLDPKS